MKDMTVVVTGGAGFIGSYVTERLLEKGYRVSILDNFSSGNLENLRNVSDNPRLAIARWDLKTAQRLEQVIGGSEVIFHFAANPEVRVGESEPRIHFEENVMATFNLLEAIRKSQRSRVFVFASTSTVYGEAAQIPTPEDYGPMVPISTYGASKLACEALVTSYVHTFNHRALILRLANVVGTRSNHGVMMDFINKIKTNPRQLEILGDGTQRKSYMHIEDCADALMHLTDRFLKDRQKIEIYNVGSSDTVTVKEIAKTAASAMKKPNIKLKFTGGVDGGRGWKGDVKSMQLSIHRLLETGWRPKYTSRQAVEFTAKELAMHVRAG